MYLPDCGYHDTLQVLDELGAVFLSSDLSSESSWLEHQKNSPPPGMAPHNTPATVAVPPTSIEERLHGLGTECPPGDIFRLVVAFAERNDSVLLHPWHMSFVFEHGHWVMFCKNNTFAPFPQSLRGTMTWAQRSLFTAAQLGGFDANCGRELCGRSFQEHGAGHAALGTGKILEAAGLRVHGIHESVEDMVLAACMPVDMDCFAERMLASPLPPRSSMDIRDLGTRVEARRTTTRAMLTARCAAVDYPVNKKGWDERLASLAAQLTPLPACALGGACLSWRQDVHPSIVENGQHVLPLCLLCSDFLFVHDHVPEPSAETHALQEVDVSEWFA